MFRVEIKPFFDLLIVNIFDRIRDDIEKEDAFRGLCAMVKLNPTGAVGSFGVMCEAIGSWHVSEVF